MGEPKKNTLDAILSAAKAEFSEKGFKSASLRNIVKIAGVTTGAFYGYLKSKEELFDALTGEQYDVFMEIFTETQNSFRELPPEVQMERMGDSLRRVCGKCLTMHMDIRIYSNLFFVPPKVQNMKIWFMIWLKSRLTQPTDLPKQWKNWVTRNIPLTRLWSTCS